MAEQITPIQEVEEWRPIPGWNDYEVSNLGQVKSLKWGKERTLKPSISPERYSQVILSSTTGTYNKKVHQLVALAFLGPCPEGMDVCHNDGDRQNNHPDNLRYDTRRGNVLDGFLHGTLANKLTLSQAKEMREKRAKGIMPARLSREYKVSSSTVANVICGKTYTRAGGPIKGRDY